MSSPIKIAVVLPRRMSFSKISATAIDLDAYDFVCNSKYRDSTTIFTRKVDKPFKGVNIKYVEDHNSSLDFKDLYLKIKSLSPHLIRVHQHRKYATYLAKKFPKIPLIFHKHNFVKTSPLKSYIHLSEYKRFSKIFLVSDSLREDFLNKFNYDKNNAITIHNGLDVSSWKPSKNRKKEILVVGRLVKEKGIIEAAKAISKVLKNNGDWQARLILSLLDDDTDYKNKFLEVVDYHNNKTNTQIIVEFNQPHKYVKLAYENCAISIVPSIYPEPFGRTALEALAGGSALISSKSGGLKEIIKDAAIELDEINVETLKNAILKLVNNEKLRNELADKGRKRALKHFDVKIISHKIDKICENLINTK